ncbi:EamA family transporter [Methylobacter sp.]|uniref:EamA family transporter n=1 Tax=Methylobacter sp. TaxID=2051955 RepID=UPI003DA3F617
MVCLPRSVHEECASITACGLILQFREIGNNNQFKWRLVTRVLGLPLVVGIMGLSAHYCMVRALSLADASVVVPLDFLRLPLIALVGYALYNERIDEFLVLGTGLIMAGNLINLLWEQKRNQSLQPVQQVSANSDSRPSRRWTFR